MATPTYTEEQHVNRTSMTSGQVTAISDTKKQLSATSVSCKTDHLSAPTSNTQNLRVSGSDVADDNGVQLKPGENFSMDINDLSLLYVIAEAAGNETLDYSYTL